jgi:hypothetical protein
MRDCEHRFECPLMTEIDDGLPAVTQYEVAVVRCQNCDRTRWKVAKDKPSTKRRPLVIGESVL